MSTNSKTTAQSCPPEKIPVPQRFAGQIVDANIAMVKEVSYGE
jgi:hypothetical protein